MMKFKNLFRLAFVFFLLMGFGATLSAQDLAEATKIYNSALPLIKNDPAGAIKSLNDCIAVCVTVGSEADSVKAAAQDKLPGAYFNLGNNQATAKELDKALESFNLAVKYGKEFNTPEVVTRSSSALARIHYMQANSFLNAKDAEKAQASINKALELEPQNATAWLIQAFIYRDAENDEEFEKAIDSSSSFSKNPNEFRQAQQAGLKYFLVKGSKLVNGNKHEAGAAALEKAVKFDQTSKDAMFFLAKAYNGLSNWDKAIEAANKGIELEEDTPEKEAKFFFEIGTAQKGKGDTSAACDSFKKAMVGQFTETAKYEIEVVLKCGQ
ncbi:MAG: tetratricopeptide repeat protein [Bacteroidales bacterium]